MCFGISINSLFSSVCFWNENKQRSEHLTTSWDNGNASFESSVFITPSGFLAGSSALNHLKYCTSAEVNGNFFRLSFPDLYFPEEYFCPSRNRNISSHSVFVEFFSSLTKEIKKEFQNPYSSFCVSCPNDINSNHISTALHTLQNINSNTYLLPEWLMKFTCCFYEDKQPIKNGRILFADYSFDSSYTALVDVQTSNNKTIFIPRYSNGSTEVSHKKTTEKFLEEFFQTNEKSILDDGQLLYEGERCCSALMGKSKNVVFIAKNSNQNSSEKNITFESFKKIFDLTKLMFCSMIYQMIKSADTHEFDRIYISSSTGDKLRKVTLDWLRASETLCPKWTRTIDQTAAGGAYFLGHSISETNKLTICV